MTKHFIFLVLFRSFAPKCGLMHMWKVELAYPTSKAPTFSLLFTCWRNFSGIKRDAFSSSEVQRLLKSTQNIANRGIS